MRCRKLQFGKSKKNQSIFIILKKNQKTTTTTKINALYKQYHKINKL